MPHAHRLRSKPLNGESADARLDSVCHRSGTACFRVGPQGELSAPLGRSFLEGLAGKSFVRPFVVAPTREVSLVIVIVRCHAAILKHAAEIPAHRSLWYSSKLTISECRRRSLMAESMARAAEITD